MNKKENKSTTHNQRFLYQVGLRSEREAVISAHFMHELNQNHLQLYNKEIFFKKALTVDSTIIFEKLIPILSEASEAFILQRMAAIKSRATKNYKLYGLSSPAQIDRHEMITEAMFDRQFVKGPKTNISRTLLAQKIKNLIDDQKPIKMDILALPYKSSSPLKCRGPLPDLAELNFLLSLVEIAKTIDLIYRNSAFSTSNTMASFVVICDGKRFNHFLNETVETVEHYEENLKWWVNKLGISPYVEIIDYQNLISTQLSKNLQIEKNKIRQQAFEFYNNLMLDVLNTKDITSAINKAIELDPEPEHSHPQGRFVPLFKSLIYIVNYTSLVNYAKFNQENYQELYMELTRHIFEPYVDLSQKDIEIMQSYMKNPQLKRPQPMLTLEYLRQSMLREAWTATINYIAEIKSDRDLPEEPIASCFPDHIRWTIHSKPGQVAVLTTTAFGDPVQPWHGIGVFKKTKHNKIKLYTLPVLALEGNNAIPVVLSQSKNDLMVNDQPLFYVDSQIKFDNIEALIQTIKQHLTRKRTW